MHSSTARSLWAPDVDRMDLQRKFLVGLLPWTNWPLSPRIVATRGDPQHAAHASHRKLVLIGLDKLVSHRFGSEKMTTAFFRMSRSCRKISTSRRRRSNSASPSGTFPLPGKASVSPWRNCCTHLASRNGVIPSSCSISRIDFSLASYNRTASSLKSRVYFRCSLCSTMSLPPKIVYLVSSRCPLYRGKLKGM